jgi:hypothetical protein
MYSADLFPKKTVKWIVFIIVQKSKKWPTAIILILNRKKMKYRLFFVLTSCEGYRVRITNHAESGKVLVINHTTIRLQYLIKLLFLLTRLQKWRVGFIWQFKCQMATMDKSPWPLNVHDEKNKQREIFFFKSWSRGHSRYLRYIFLRFLGATKKSTNYIISICILYILLELDSKTRAKRSFFSH